MYGLDIEPGAGPLGVAAEHGERHKRVDGAHLADQRVEYGLVSGVAHAVGAADEHARASAAALALEYLSVDLYLLAAGGVYGVLARGLLEKRRAERGAQDAVQRQPGYPLAERLVVPDIDEVARLAVYYELRYAPDAGGDRGQAVRRALGDGVGEGLGQAREGVDIYGAVEFVHVVEPAAERQGVGHAQLFGKSGEVRALRALSGDDEPEVRGALARLGHGAHQGGQVLDRVEPGGRADNDVAGLNPGADALIKRRAVSRGYAAAEVYSVIYGEGVVAAEAALDEQAAHRV